MEEARYRQWLESMPTKLKESSVRTLITDAKRIEKDLGVDLDAEFAKDRLDAIIERLTYTTEDERRKRPNETGLRFGPNVKLRGTIAAYKATAERYRLCCESQGGEKALQWKPVEPPKPVETEVPRAVARDHTPASTADLEDRLAILEIGYGSLSSRLDRLAGRLDRLEQTPRGL
jgi:hypothetical protein